MAGMGSEAWGVERSEHINKGGARERSVGCDCVDPLIPSVTVPSQTAVHAAPWRLPPECNRKYKDTTGLMTAASQVSCSQGRPDTRSGRPRDGPAAR